MISMTDRKTVTLAVDYRWHSGFFHVITSTTFADLALARRLSTNTSLELVAYCQRLIAIMLSRLRMPVSDCIKEYKRLCESMFGHPRKFHALNVPLIQRTKYKTSYLERELQVVVEKRYKSVSFAHRPFKFKKDLCKTYVSRILSKDWLHNRNH